MHEGAIARNIIETLEREIAEDRIPGKVKTINLRVGRLMAVIPENLDFLFDIMARGTALDGAKITIRKVPIRARCEACGADFEISEVYFLCPKCHSPKVDVLSGRELVIEDVEVM